MKPYKMPTIEKNDLVYWYPDGSRSSEPAPAIVTAVGDRAVSVSIVLPGIITFTIRDGVRHADDPGNRDNSEDGTWDYTPQHKRYLDLVATIERMTAGSAKKAG